MNPHLAEIALEAIHETRVALSNLGDRAENPEKLTAALDRMIAHVENNKLPERQLLSLIRDMDAATVGFTALDGGEEQ